jgi:Tol biopolymer transport system component
VRLTNGALDVHPDVSPDSRWVFYASFVDWSPAIGGQPTLWRVPIEGGQPLEITHQPASYPRVSPDGKTVGCIYFPAKDPRFSADHIAVLGLEHGRGFRIYDASPGDETTIAWSPDGRAVDYILNTVSGGNVWRQPLDGSPARQVTRFTSDELYAFSWAPDGRLAYVRGVTTRAAVLIENLR